MQTDYPDFTSKDLVKIIEFFVGEEVTYMLNYPEYCEEGDTDVDFIKQSDLEAGHTNNILCSGTATLLDSEGNGYMSMENWMSNDIEIPKFADYFGDIADYYGITVTMTNADASEHFY